MVIIGPWAGGGPTTAEVAVKVNHFKKPIYLISKCTNISSNFKIPANSFQDEFFLDVAKAELLLPKLIHLFAREVLLVKMLEMEETKIT